MSAVNYATIHDYISTAPSCALPCLNAFWNPHIASCGGSSNWACLCAAGPGGSTTNQQQQIADTPGCQTPFCSGTDMDNLVNAREDFATFCENFPAGELLRLR